MNLWDRIAQWYQSSLLRELLDFLNEQVFGMEFGEYEHFSIGAETAQMLRTIVLAMAFGVIAAAFLAVWTKTVPGGFVRKLLKLQIHSPEKAITLSQAGYFRSVGIRRELSHGGALSKIVWRVGDEALKQTAAVADGKKPDNASQVNNSAEPQVADNAPQVRNSAEPCTAENASQVSNPAKKGVPAQSALPLAKPFRFQTDRFYIPEDLRYRAEFRYDNRGSGWPVLILSVAVILFVAFLLCRFLPPILGLLDGLATLLGG